MGGFVITVSTITWYEIQNCQRLPFPSRIVMTGLVFGLVDLLSMINPELGGVVGIGIVLAAIVNKGFVTGENGCATLPCRGTVPPHCGQSTIQQA